jgi:hypothetical protein
LDRSSLSYTPFGVVTYPGGSYPLVRVKLGDPRKPAILVSAGVHGNEIAGVYAALRFIEEHAENYISKYCFYVYPCLNPHGFDLDIRWNSADPLLRRDINRNFTYQTSVAECLAFYASLEDGPISYELTFDLHETLEDDAQIMAAQYGDRDSTGYEDTPREFYFWETCRDHDERIGSVIIDALSESIPFCTWDTIFGDTNSGGAIYYPEGCINPDYVEGPLDSFLERYFTAHSFTSETYGGWDLERRIATQIKFLCTALDLLIPT